MNKKIMVFWATVFFSIVLLSGQDFDATFNYANRLYVDKKYQQAYEKYQQILEGGFESGELYYNLGNTAYRLKRNGEAILYFEKALRFLPEDSDVKYNLKLLKMQVVDRIEMPERPFFIEWYDSLKKSAAKPGNENIVYLGMILLAVIWSFWVYFRKRDFSKWVLSTAVLLSVIWSVFFSFWNLGHADLNNTRRAVLLVNRTEVKAEPDNTGETLFILHEGATFKIKRSSDDWAEIQLIDGKSGWVVLKTIGEI